MAQPHQERALLIEFSDTVEGSKTLTGDPQKHLYVNRDVALDNSALCRGLLAMNPRK
jgi:hypothetical protein